MIQALLITFFIFQNIAFADDEPGGWVEPGGYDPVAEEAKNKRLADEAEQKKKKESQAAIAKAKQKEINKIKESLKPENMAKVSDENVCIKAGIETRSGKEKHWINEANRRQLSFDRNEAISRIVTIGTTECGIFASMGKPERISRTVTSRYIHKQFIYYKTYIYTDNGRVTSWQD